MQPSISGEENVGRIDRVAFVGGCFDGGLTQRSLISVLWVLAVAPDSFCAHLDSNEPPLPLLITGDFDAVGGHVHSMTEYSTRVHTGDRMRAGLSRLQHLE